MSSQKLNYINQNLTGSEFLAHEHEPNTKLTYDLSPELEDELLEHGVFLKQRVWRNMRKFRRYNSRLQRRQNVKEPRYRTHRIHNHRLAHS